MKIFFAIFASISLCFALNYKNISCDFTQEVISVDKKLSYKGTFVITKTQAFWSYTSPVIKQIYVNGDQVVILEPQLEQAIITKLKELPNLTLIMEQATKVSKNEMQAKYKNIIYNIVFKDDLPAMIYYKDEFENIVKIHLKNVKIDQEINPLIFKVHVPKEFDIVK